MAGAMQVLALSDDEENVSFGWNTPRAQPRPRTRSQYTPKTPVTKDVVCLDSDDEMETVVPAEVIERLKVIESQEAALQLEWRPECTPVTTVQEDDEDDCCITQEKPSSNGDSSRRAIIPLLADCCIVKTTPPSSRVSRMQPSSSSQSPGVVNVMSETGTPYPDMTKRRLEIFSIKDIMKQIPLTDSGPDAFEGPYTPPEVAEEIEKPAKRRKKSHIATRACEAESRHEEIAPCSDEMLRSTSRGHKKTKVSSPACDLETRHEGEEAPCGDGILRSGSVGQQKTKVASCATPTWDVETRHEGDEAPGILRSAPGGQRKTKVASRASPVHDVETRHEGEENSCGDGILRGASGGQQKTKVASCATPTWDVETRHEGYEAPFGDGVLRSAPGGQKKTKVASRANPVRDVETRHEGEVSPCGDKSHRSASRGEKNTEVFSRAASPGCDVETRHEEAPCIDEIPNCASRGQKKNKVSFGAASPACDVEARLEEVPCSDEIARSASRGSQKKSKVPFGASPACDVETRHEEAPCIDDIPIIASRGQKKTKVSSRPASPACDVETRHEEAPCSFEIPRSASRGQKKTNVSFVAASPARDVETRHEAAAPCNDEIPRTASRGQKISDEERLRRIREKELALERKQAEKLEKERAKEEAKKKQQEDAIQKKEEEKARKAAAKKAVQLKRKAENEVAKFKRKAALEHMVASVDTGVAEKGFIGGSLLSRFVEKNLRYTLVSNPMRNSITWRTKRLRLGDSQEIDQSEDAEILGSQGELNSQVVQEDVHIQYILFVLEADEFSEMVANKSLASHVQEVQQHYPGYTICYLVNKLMSFLQKKSQAIYQSNDPINAGWQRPRVEKALAGLTTNFTGVHSRLCVDEADVADHVTGLMQSFADNLYKPKQTRLSVNKNGEHVRHDDPFKDEIRRSQWLKALVAIPKVSGPCAIAIGRVYPSMRSLLKVYLDKGKTDREKELLLEDLKRESIFGSTAGQRIGAVCSKQIYRVLMAQNGNLKVDQIDHETPEE